MLSLVKSINNRIKYTYDSFIFKYFRIDESCLSKSLNHKVIQVAEPPKGLSRSANFHIVRSNPHIFWEYGRNVAAGGPPEPAKLFKWSMRKKTLGTFGLNQEINN